MEKKYTAAEYALMSGGHSIESKSIDSLNLTFINDLTESRMFRTRQQAETTDARSMIDFAFMNLLTLQLLYSNYETAPIAKEYAAKTIEFRSFDSFKPAQTDLYLALNGIKTGKLGGGEAARIQMNKLKVPYQTLVDYLYRMSQGKEIPNPMSVLTQIEKGMDIQDSNYKAVRRLVTNWQSMDASSRKIAITRMLQFYRTKAIRSQLYGVLNDYAKTNNLELKTLHNAEQPSKIGKAAIKAAAFAGGVAAGRQFGKWLMN
jgi:hypothetical protein